MDIEQEIRNKNQRKFDIPGTLKKYLLDIITMKLGYLTCKLGRHIRGIDSVGICG